jgi:putative ABC transport system permease protein
MSVYLTAFRQATRALLAYKVRTLLTMLGIIIGIGTIIIMMSIGRGANKSIQDQIASMGTNLLYVVSGTTKKGGVRGGKGSRATLRVKDAEAIARSCPSVKGVTYLIYRNQQIVAGKNNWGTSVQGTTSEYAEITSWPMRDGEFISHRHMRSSAGVAVLGSEVANNLFAEGVDPIGQKIRIRNFPFKVIGVLSAKGRTPDGRDADDVVFVPYTTAMRRLMGRRLPGVVYFILASAHSKEQVLSAKAEMEDILRSTHKIKAGGEDDFSVGTLDEFADAAEASTKTMTYLMMAVASISLVVGGIGIMNIMLVTVTERTREIGVRIAVGAREKDVLIQFLVESVTISVSGGILGAGLGIGVSKLISQLAGWPTIISVDSILLATVFSGVVGIFFGFYPAKKASQLDPIEALRYE